MRVVTDAIAKDLPGVRYSQGSRDKEAQDFSPGRNWRPSELPLTQLLIHLVSDVSVDHILRDVAHCRHEERPTP